MNCPYCQSDKVFYSSSRALHAVRFALSSRKRYCGSCQKKWRTRPRGKTKNHSFYMVTIPLVLIFSMGMLKLSERGQGELASFRSEQKAENPLAGGTPLLMNKGMMEKVKKLQSNPQAMARLSGERKKMAEKAIKYMKASKKR